MDYIGIWEDARLQMHSSIIGYNFYHTAFSYSWNNNSKIYMIVAGSHSHFSSSPHKMNCFWSSSIHCKAVTGTDTCLQARETLLSSNGEESSSIEATLITSVAHHTHYPRVGKMQKAILGVALN